MIQVDVKNNSFSFQQQALMFLECKVWLDWEMVSYFFMSKSTDFSTLKERSICFSGPWPHITIILQVSVSIAIFFLNPRVVKFCPTISVALVSEQFIGWMCK